VSGLGLALAAAAAAPSLTSTGPALEPPVLRNAIHVALPSLDTGRGIQIGYEHWLPTYKLAWSAYAEARESATGDYTGIRTGVGGRVRWYWRSDAWLSRLPAGNMVGWFLGGGVAVAGDFTHDGADHRWLGSALELGVDAEIGYRIAPWRRLVITPWTGVEVHRDVQTRIPDWTRYGAIVGLDAGWLF
jgi:hypothetical protein